MQICAAQIRPVAGDMAANTVKHLELIELAIARGADLIFFPELSLTGYEPRLAKSLATDQADRRLDVFQQRSDADNIIIGLGLPIAAGSQVQIGMIWFAPHEPRREYKKQRLHESEMPFFVPGDGQLFLEAAGHKLAPAICYESLVPDHADNAASLGADVYLASVAKPAGALAKAMLHYPAIARKHNMYVIMADCAGPSDDFVSVGQSAVWNNRGELLASMDAESEGLLMVDTSSGSASMHALVHTDRFAGMTVNERLVEGRVLDAFDRAARQRDKRQMIEVLLTVAFTEKQATQTADAILANPAHYGY